MWDIKCGLLDDMGERGRCPDVPAGAANGDIQIEVCNNMI